MSQDARRLRQALIVDPVEECQAMLEALQCMALLLQDLRETVTSARIVVDQVDMATVHLAITPL